MDTPLRVFVAATSADERRRLRDEARRAGWRLVDAADDADVVLGPAAQWRAPAGGERGEDRDPLVEALTPREREVLGLLADGVGNREIAQTLGISEHTVKFHLGAIFGKLGAATRTDAVRRGLRLGLIDL
ncbi:MAG: LuxR C-terminal-related transcriptional regulator [Vicinamibacterales bacterium]